MYFIWFQPRFINDVYNLSDITIQKIKDTNYRCIIKGISKSEAINLLIINNNNIIINN